MSTASTHFNRSSPQLVIRLWSHLTRRRKRQFVLVLGLMVVGAVAEVVSLGAVLPFLGVLIAPDRVLKNASVAHFARVFDIRTADELLLPLTLAFAVAAVAAGSIRMLLMWVSTRLAFAAGADFSIEVYRRTLYQPYAVHVARNSSEVISGITSKVLETVNVFTALLLLSSSVMMLVTITLALIVIDPVVAVSASAGFGLAYALIGSYVRRRLDRNGRLIAAEQTQLIKTLQEGLGGIRDVLLEGAQEIYCDTYRRADAVLRRAQANNMFIASSPRFAMEAVGMVLIAVLAYGLGRQPGGVATALPVLGTLALGAQRLLPALQQAFNSWAIMASSGPVAVEALELLDQPLPPDASLPAPAPLPFGKTVSFHKLRFRYSSDGPWVLDGIDLVIPKGARIGIVGTTGGGKSTALDLLMGLLQPTQGELLVDGEAVQGGRLRAWQRAIAHVPQSIFLADASLAENIALGVPHDSIDLERVKLAARQAHIADFIEARPQGYQGLVGERGVRLSGGQRQRVGIARALYKQASVLVFDEATSALDTATERSVMEAISGLHRDLTIILIAHRITTVRQCDTIVELGNGRVVAQGTFEQLLERSPSFRAMARAVA